MENIISRTCKFYMRGKHVPIEEVLHYMEWIGQEVFGEANTFCKPYSNGEYLELYCSAEDDYKVMIRISRLYPETRFVLEFHDIESDWDVRDCYFAGKCMMFNSIYVYPNYSDSEWLEKGRQFQEQYLKSKEPISYQDFFDRQFRGSGEICEGYRKLLQWIPDRLKESYAVQHPQNAAFYDGIY